MKFVELLQYFWKWRLESIVQYFCLLMAAWARLLCSHFKKSCQYVQSIRPMTPTGSTGPSTKYTEYCIVVIQKPSICADCRASDLRLLLAARVHLLNIQNTVVIQKLSILYVQSIKPMTPTGSTGLSLRTTAGFVLFYLVETDFLLVLLTVPVHVLYIYRG